MAEDIDFNDVLDDIFLSENKQCEQSYQEGYKAGTEAGNAEGYHLGYHRGAELGRELGYYLGIVSYHLENKDKQASPYSEKIIKQLEKVQELINTFPRTNSEEHDILALAENIRAQYRKACALLKIPSTNPYGKITMSSTIHRLQNQLDKTITFLTPHLPLANCHMVEFFTDNHWDKLLPQKLREYLDNCDLNQTVEQFWRCAGGNYTDNSELSKWMQQTRGHCLTVNSEYCLSAAELQECIKRWGGQVETEVRISEFMNTKKSYEVQTMSALVASLSTACGATHCAEAGGGRGHLLVALSLAYHLPSLTIDCDEKTIAQAQKKVKIIQKQWHAIAKRVRDGTEERISGGIDAELHRFATSFITNDTDLLHIVREKFPEHSHDDIKLLLTGLHTCGNLGPTSLRLFSRSPQTSAVFTVPCCYHLLSEEVDEQMFDVFQRDYGENQWREGFPMAQRLKGYNLGRNARMLAAQSIDRVVHHKQPPDKSLLYRALLQVIIKKYLPNLPVTEGKLKGIATKCQDFNDYFKMADSLLKLDLYDSLPGTYLTDIHKSIDDQWKKIVLFYFVRLCLAQVIESVILLDRLLFLFENGFEKCYLVKLFDPVLSPRCHSIVAVR
ncbi:probable methyltransferase-like protein 25 isoform X2 [Maniola jurtina]|uniref:probable methyltransferase-like protein 25 isoform X2 n=1 Tax=Maniola jurtina TaxID=191418 RepID=UPI001E686CFB|nr:probable methyltransferase-like protein 25 isoform X2 [Maniola jurtina]